MGVEETVSAARAAARLSKSLEVALGDTGLSLPQYRLLLFLSGGSERATALAGSLAVSPPSLTALVDGAVARGLVQRVPAPDDRRAVRHEITDDGHRLLTEADGALAAKLDDIVGHLSGTERQKVVDGLRLLGKGLDLARQAQVAAAAK